MDEKTKKELLAKARQDRDLSMAIRQMPQRRIDEILSRIVTRSRRTA